MDLLVRVEAICSQDLSDRLLRERLIALLAGRLPFDGHVFALTDPVTGVGSSPHATVPMLPWDELPDLLRHRYLHFADDRPAWHAWLAHLGVTDTLFVDFADRYGRWGFLELWRAGGAYDARDLALLERLAPAINHGLRSAAARTFRAGEDGLAQVEPGVVVLDPDLRVRGQTDSAAAALLRLLPPDEPMPPIPAAAYNAGAALVAVEAGRWSTEPSARVHLGGNRWVTVRAARLGDDIAVAIAPSTVDERTDLFARVHGLSPRETEVLGLAVHGLDSREIADLLVIARTTAEDHLKALLAKTGAPSRQVLVARALGA
ncbi:LuxR C-terminal-related transcriptional regulator [Nocardioides sp. HM23]|uniref:helix-turn-helix transcriptional regulator n=1 Tax=Nocardioides bizhenqiangii TaxID=3095076 RepID=UPI002ACA9CD6|nr:LuxR C-terminal-related transcriptional regulator [Nocardioides sp. HM23]MDZ5620535.1 LuxR C-terminal-related transcriptional regulator [Nocardioides sp. HM23]